MVGSALPTSAAPAGWAAPGVSWTNGVVLCQFPSTGVGVSVSALNLSGSGLSVEPSFIEEAAPSGSIVAEAQISASNWTNSNVSTANLYDELFLANVSILPGHGGLPLGVGVVGISYLLSGYPEDSLASRSLVYLVWTVANWSWQGPGDRLVLGFSAGPTFPANETLVPGTSTDSPFSSRSVATGATREFLELAGSANVSDAGGNQSVVPTESQTVLGAANASVMVSLGSAAGEFHSMMYTVTIGIPFPSSVAQLPLSDYLMVVGGGSAVAIAAAVGSARLRRRPSSLEFVEGDDE